MQAINDIIDAYYKELLEHWERVVMSTQEAKRQFKVGDRVLCTEDSAYGVKKGFVYTVINPSIGGTCLEVLELLNTYHAIGRFELAGEGVSQGYENVGYDYSEEAIRADQGVAMQINTSKCSCDLYNVLLRYGCQCGGK